MIARLLSVPLLLASLWPVSAAAEAPCPESVSRLDPDLGALVDPVIDRALDRGFAGGVALMRDGVVVYDRVAGSADLRGKVPVTAETLFHVASISKYFTAALSLAAVEEGRIELTGPIAPRIPGTDLARHDLTFLDLLAHRSGLGSSYAAERVADAGEALTAIAGQPVDDEAAGSFRYSNDGYDLLAILLERAYDRRFEELLREKLFQRACVDKAGFWGESDLLDPRIVAQPLRRLGAGIRRRNYGMISSSGVLITARDLARYQHALADGRLLSSDSLRELTAPRGEVSIGQATLGAFLIDHAELGRVLSARGYQDWGDNAILNHYLDHDLILAVVTSRGPAEKTGEPPFRSEISGAIEELLATRLAATSLP